MTQRFRRSSRTMGPPRWRWRIQPHDEPTRSQYSMREVLRTGHMDSAPSQPLARRPDTFLLVTGEVGVGEDVEHVLEDRLVGGLADDDLGGGHGEVAAGVGDEFSQGLARRGSVVGREAVGVEVRLVSAGFGLPLGVAALLLGAVDELGLAALLAWFDGRHVD